jgi:hydroxymethylpyrimidine pyrophosphatase-like HAD family hydrolase
VTRAPAIRVLYTDVDGTLVGPLGNLFWTEEREWTLDAAEALVAAHRAGLEIVPLTGRSRMQTMETARLVGAAHWIAELGGVRSYDWGDEVVVATGAYTGAALTADLRDLADALVAASPGRLEEHHPWNRGRESSLLLRGEIDLPTADGLLRARGGGWACLLDNGVIPRRYDGIPDVDRPRAYHLAPRGVSKRDAIAADRAHRGLAIEECAIVGDSFSDVECHAEVGRCFVVANALEKDPELKAALVDLPTVEVTDRGHGQGFADVVAALLSAG